MGKELIKNEKERKKEQLQYIFKKLFEHGTITLAEYSKAIRIINDKN